MDLCSTYLLITDIFIFRKDCEFINNTVRPFDWTYTTDYKGTIKGSPEYLKVFLRFN